MKLEVLYLQLETLCDRMGAPRISWSSNLERLAPPDFEAQLIAGIEVPLDEVVADTDGILRWRDQTVILYIAEHLFLDNAENPDELRKFHIAECSTLEEMRRRDRFERYVVTRRTDGLFRITLGAVNKTAEAPLLVCWNCLSRLNWDNFRRMAVSEKQVARRSFELERFLKVADTSFASHPSQTDDTVTGQTYSPDFREISRRLRRERGYVCETCGVSCAERRDRSLLHVHHRNGRKSDNRPENLQVLCALCHRQIDRHLKIRKEDEHRLKQLRAAQGRRG